MFGLKRLLVASAGVKPYGVIVALGDLVTRMHPPFQPVKVVATPAISFAGRVQDLLRRLGLVEDRQRQARHPDGRSAVEPVVKRVSLIIHNPTIPSAGGQKLSQVLGWNNPDQLCEAFIDDLHEISYGYANYEIVERIEVDKFPLKADGFVYQADSFVQSWHKRGPLSPARRRRLSRLAGRVRYGSQGGQGRYRRVLAICFPLCRLLRIDNGWSGRFLVQCASLGADSFRLASFCDHGLQLRARRGRDARILWPPCGVDHGTGLPPQTRP